MLQVKIIAKSFMDMVASWTAWDLDRLSENSCIYEAIVRVEYQLPSLIVAAITKESLLSLLSITTEKIRLRESDLNSIETTPGYYYDEFPSRDVFESPCDYAPDRNCLLWEDSKKMRLVVEAEIQMRMKEFLQGQSK